MSHRPRRRLTALIACTAALAACAVLTPTASATKYCVFESTPGACVAGTVEIGNAGLTTALGAAGIGDTVEINPGAYSSAAGWTAGGATIKGVGTPLPQLSATNTSAATTVLTVNSGSAVISNLRLTVPAASGGMAVNSTVGGAQLLDLSVTDGGSDGGIGLQVQGNGSNIKRATIDMSGATSGNTTGVNAINGASSLKVYDSTIANAVLCVTVGSTISTGITGVDVARLNARCDTGVKFTNSTGMVSSSLLRAPSAAAAPGGVVVVNSDGASYAAVKANNDTIVGNGSSSDAGLSIASTVAGGSNAISADSTVIVDENWSFTTNPFSGSTTDISAAYTRWDGINDGATADGTSPALTPGTAGFVDAAGGDFHLQKTSPLVDTGNPSVGLQGSATDLDGNNRVVSRGAGDIRDVGAYELPNSAPVATIGVSADPTATAPTVFSGAGSTDADGDALTFGWKLDSNIYGSGANWSRLVNTTGPHSVELTVTDSTGLSSSTSRQFSVAKGALTIALNKKALKAGAKGTFKYKLACPAVAASSCNGKLLFKYNGKKAAQFVFSVDPGATRSLTIQSYKTFRKLLAKKHKAKLTATLSGAADNASLAGGPTSFVLKG